VEHTFDNPDGAFRVLVLGDSFMEGYSVELNESFHKRIEQFLREKGFDVEVINLGVGGYSTLQEYLVFREVGLLYKPNLVLLGFTICNDLRNNSMQLEFLKNGSAITKKRRPFLDLDNYTNWKVIPVDLESIKARYDAAKKQQNSFMGKLARQSALLQTWQRAKKHILRRLQIDQEQWYLAYYGQNYCKEPPEYAKAWDITKDILARLKHDTESIGSKLVVFTVPCLRDVDTTKINKILEDAPNGLQLCLDEAPANFRLKNVLNQLSIDYVDLFPDFRNAMQDGVTILFRRSERHWNSEGHALAAEIVGSHLIENNLITAPGAAE
jgi:hypothetical protein